jgi:putative ABC transport system permease protein
VGDTAEDDLAGAPPAVVYVANDQGSSTFLSYMIRTAGDPAAFVATARAALREMDPRLPLIQPQTLEQIADQSPSVFLRRYPSYLIGGFAGLALLLAMIGLYGLISYGVAQRTREIGIRITLGAQRGDVLRLVLRQGLAAVLVGVAVGVAAGLGLTRLLSSVLFGVKPGDWMTFASVSILLLMVAMGASMIPARRAMKVDPAIALRQQ